MTWIIKACPRCGGSYYREDGIYYCLNCGMTLEWSKLKKEESNGLSKKVHPVPVLR